MPQFWCVCVNDSERSVNEHEDALVQMEEVREAINNLKNEKTARVDGIITEIMKYDGEGVIEWMNRMCGSACEEAKVPRDWTNAISIPLYKGESSRKKCENYRGISVMSKAVKCMEELCMKGYRRLQKVGLVGWWGWIEYECDWL